MNQQLKTVLDALGKAKRQITHANVAPHGCIDEAIEIVNQMMQAEPVGEADSYAGRSLDHTQAVFSIKDVPLGTQLYLQPAPQTPQPVRKPLTQTEIFNIIDDHSALGDVTYADCIKFARAIERACCGTSFDQAAPPAVPAWLSASNPPTESQGEVLVLMQDGTCEIAWATYWHGSSNAFAGWTFRDPDMEDAQPTHWMPLPAAPAVKETE